MTASFESRLSLACALIAALAVPTAAQTLPPNSPFLGGVPDRVAAPEALPLSMAEAVRRALGHNLGILLADQQVARATGARRVTFADLLPHVSASLAETRRKTNLEAFGFPLQEGFPRVVGPFNVFDARVFVTQRVLDFTSLARMQAADHALEADRLGYRDARDLVVLVTANLYLETLAADARVAAVEAQRTTAQALFDQAIDLRNSGLAAGIDVVRAEVQLSTARQRATAARHDFDKLKLQLARVTGLPAGQAFTLTDAVPFAPPPDLPLAAALERAYAARPDYLSALARVREAEARERAVRLASVPTVHLNADYGAIGLTAGTALSTFSVAGTVSVPLFEGGRQAGRRVETASDVRARQAEADSLRAQIDYDVRVAFLDIEAASEALGVAARARELAALQLTQARDRFAAGVVTNIEVVQAQEAVAAASEGHIGALYAFNVAKALLARALGATEQAVQSYFGGSTP